MKIITLEEFFKYKQMFQGLPEDQSLACEIYNNANYENKEVLDKLMVKALMFEDRVNFCTAVKYTLNVGELSTKKIYAFLEKKKVNKKASTQKVSTRKFRPHEKFLFQTESFLLKFFLFFSFLLLFCCCGKSDTKTEGYPSSAFSSHHLFSQRCGPRH